MKKIGIGIIIAASFLLASNTQAGQENNFLISDKVHKEIEKSLSNTETMQNKSRLSVEIVEKTPGLSKAKEEETKILYEKDAKCKKYLEKADEVLENLVNNNLSINATQSYSLYANTLIKRYELCLKETSHYINLDTPKVNNRLEK